MRERLTFAKNAASNVVNGMVGAVVLIVVPHFFVHDFSPAQFSLWILILQLGNLVNVLNVGLSVAIGRFVAVSAAHDDVTGMARITAAGVQILTMLAVLGLLLVGLVAVLLPAVYVQIEPDLIPAARQAILWVGGSLALGLPVTGLSGAMIGLRRNELPAAVNAIGKTALGIALVVTAAHTHDLVSVARVFFIMNCLTYALNILVFRWLCRNWRLPLMAGLAGSWVELARYCVSLSVWSVSMLLVTGVDTSIVGAFDYHAVAAYGLAANLGVFFGGAVNVMMNPLIQVFAGLHARGDIQASLRLLRISSFFATSGLIFAGMWMVGLAHYGFTLWVGKRLAVQAFPFFCLLVLSNTIRNSATPYTLYLLGTGQQQRVMLTPFMEGVSNFIASVIGCWLFGAIGVAIGAVVGAGVGVVANFIYNMPRTLPSGFFRLGFFGETWVRPILLGFPGFVVLFWLRPDDGTPLFIGSALGVCSLLIALLLWCHFRGFEACS
jgi:O-antigen/teichoic acid export membrane protein